MSMHTAQIVTTYANNDYSTMFERADLMEALGLDPFGNNDTDFGVEFVFCAQHLSVHSTGWCAAGNETKLPLAAMDLEGAEVEAKAKLARCALNL